MQPIFLLPFYRHYNIIQGVISIACVETAGEPAISFDFQAKSLYCVVRQRETPQKKEESL